MKQVFLRFRLGFQAETCASFVLLSLESLGARHCDGRSFSSPRSKLMVTESESQDDNDEERFAVVRTRRNFPLDQSRKHQVTRAISERRNARFTVRERTAGGVAWQERMTLNSCLSRPGDDAVLLGGSGDAAAESPRCFATPM